MPRLTDEAMDATIMRILLRSSPPKIAKMIIGFISIPMSYLMLFAKGSILLAFEMGVPN
jgi:hypothetical protein